ncbi:MAG TPA: hypothetical protein VN155_16910 [Devosia sp.]|nr:hypothetical protein [Devosia sp.]
MGDILFIDVAQRKKNDRLQALWQAYLEARAKADATGNIADGIAAGKAWAAWVEPFTGRAS